MNPNNVPTPTFRILDLTALAAEASDFDLDEDEVLVNRDVTFGISYATGSGGCCIGWRNTTGVLCLRITKAGDGRGRCGV